MHPCVDAGGHGRRAATLGRCGLAVAALAFGLAACAGPAALPSTATHTFAVTSPKAATIGGEIYRPSGAGPFPAVLVMHGCNGVGPNMHDWGQWLQSEGYVAFVLDSFSARGIKRVCGDPFQLLPRDRSPDVYAAATYLRSLPFVDGERIAAMGFSHGGSTVLWAGTSDSRYPDNRLRGFIAFYPGCGDVIAYGGRSPLLLLLGAKDDWTPAEPCQRLAEAAQNARKPVTAVLYPNARHAFDASRINGVVFVADARRGRGATIAYDPQAHEDSLKQVRKFLKDNLTTR